MRLSRFLFLFRAFSGPGPGKMIYAGLSVAFASAVLLAAGSLALSGLRDLYPRLAASFQERRLVARGGTMRIGPVEFGGRIPEQLLQKVEVLEGVEFVSPQAPLQVPVYAEVTLLGNTFITEVVVYGVESRLVSDTIPEGKVFENPSDPEAPIPCVISRFFADLYNFGLAETNRLPRLAPQHLLSKTFTLNLGESYSIRERPEKTKTRDCVVIALTDDPAMLGAVLPLETVRQLNRWYHGENHPQTYNLLHVQLKSMHEAEAVIGKLESMGLRVEDRGRQLIQIQLAMGLGIGILLFLGTAVLAISLLNLSNTFSLLMVHKRSRIGLFRALGLTASVAEWLLRAEVILVALSGGLTGCIAGMGLIRLGNELANRYLPTVFFLPESPLAAPPGLIGGCLFVCLAGGWLVASGLVRGVHKDWPARLLSR